MKLLQVNNISKNDWESFNLQAPYPSLFQSWPIGESEKKQKTTVYRVSLKKNNRLTGIAQIYKINAQRGTFLHLRGGPVLADFNDLPLLIDFVKNQKFSNNSSFIRISPPHPPKSRGYELLKKTGFRRSPIALLDGEVSWILNINRPLEEILKNMRKTTRYLIKKAQSSNLKIEVSTRIQSCQELLVIYKKMTTDKNIIPHKGIKREFEELVKEARAEIVSASYKGKVLGAALIIFYGKEAIYHHSAHLRTENLPVSYLIQWQAIMEAQKRHCLIYNFWGIDPSGNPHHPWAGLSKFKMGFGGEKREFIGTYDLPLKIGYLKTWAIESVRRITRYKTF